jgi:hypothetical protein
MAWWTTCSSKEGYATSHKQRHCNAKEEERLSCCWKMIGILCVLMWRRLRKEVCVCGSFCTKCTYLFNQQSYIYPHHYLVSFHHSLFPNYLPKIR